MNEQTTSNTANDDEEETNSPLEELALLKDRARQMGIPISGNIGVDKLRDRIANHLAGQQEEEEEEAEEEEVAAPVVAATPKPRPLTKAEKEQKLRRDVQAENLSLVRCRIYNLNPMKRDLPGEIITVANRYLGTVAKYIPFGEATEGGYHIPKVLYKNLKGRKFQQVTTRKIPGTAQIEVKRRMVPEYNIELLPPLTKAELSELGLKQAAAQRLERE